MWSGLLGAQVNTATCLTLTNTDCLSKHDGNWEEALAQRKYAEGRSQDEGRAEDNAANTLTRHWNRSTEATSLLKMSLSPSKPISFFVLVRTSGPRATFAYIAHWYILLNRSEAILRIWKSFSRHLFSGTHQSNKYFSGLVCSKVYPENEGSQLSWGTKTGFSKNIFTFLKLYTVFQVQIYYKYLILFRQQRKLFFLDANVGNICVEWR